MMTLPSGESWSRIPQASLQRAALWNPYFYRFFGSAHEQVERTVRPLSGDESCTALTTLIDALGGQHPRPRILRRCLSRMWNSGYRPSNRDYHERFRKLAQQAVPTAPPEEAFVAVVDDRSDNPSRAVRVQPDPMVAEARISPDSEPSLVTFDGNVWTTRKELLIHRRIEKVGQLINPIRWQRLSPFFKATWRVEPSTVLPLDEGWSGILHETVRVNWNTIKLEQYDVLLKIDYTVTDDVARADYSLKHEQDNKIVVDDGYVEARRVSPEVTRYTLYKRLRFASSFTNLIAPALLCMLLENDEDGLRHALEGDD